MASFLDKQAVNILETDTSKLEIMEFTIADELFGINVAKVKEILKYSPVKPMQNAHPVIEGIFKPRDQVITVVDLAKYLGFPPSDGIDRNIFIVTNFNKKVFAFHVHSVVGIARIPWNKIQKPDKIIYGGSDGIATLIAEHEDRLITILDFEKITAEISPAVGLNINDVDKAGVNPKRKHVPILIAEDSITLVSLIAESLNKAGYTNIITTTTGQEAWDFFEIKKSEDVDIKHFVQCVITDIEMPQMDGHSLTKLIKEDEQLRDIPVVLFSSVSNDQLRHKGEQCGADAQITKPEIHNLVEVVDKLTGIRLS